MPYSAPSPKRDQRGWTAITVSPSGTDPLHRGAYTYALTGHASARATLGTPLADGRLTFAGEAVCTDGPGSTVGGAFLSGERAAGMAVGV